MLKLGEPKSQFKIRRHPINSSDNISSNFHKLLDTSLIGFAVGLATLPVLMKPAQRAGMGPSRAKNITRPTNLRRVVGAPLSRFMPATPLPFHARRCLLQK